MLNIFICEDNIKEKDLIERYVRNAAQRNEILINIIVSTKDPYRVLDSISVGSTERNMYFLDVRLNSDMNGLKLARNIREKDEFGYIVFITTHSELTLLTFEYKIRALDFIVKDDFLKIKSRIEECLLLVNEELGRKKSFENVRTITVKSGPKIYNIPQNEIIFIETGEMNHKVKVHTMGQIIEFYGTMKEIESELDGTLFFRCHRSYLVNLYQVREIDSDKLELTTKSGKKCFISQRYLKGLVDRWSL